MNDECNPEHCATQLTDVGSNRDRNRHRPRELYFVVNWSHIGSMDTNSNPRLDDGKIQLLFWHVSNGTRIQSKNWKRKINNRTYWDETVCSAKIEQKTHSLQADLGLKMTYENCLFVLQWTDKIKIKDTWNSSLNF